MKIVNYRRPDWENRTAIVIASGPSLTREDCELVRQAREADTVRVVSVSNAYKMCAPWADIYYAADRRYWMTYYQPMLKAGVPQKSIWTACSATAERCGVHKVRSVNKPGLGDQILHTNGNSGAMGVGMAALFGAKRIVMLGMDMQAGPRGLKHFDGDHPLPLVQSMPFGEWIKKFEAIKTDAKSRGIQLLNASRSTALTKIDRVPLEEILNLTKENA